MSKKETAENYTEDEIKQFLVESNAIEGVYDVDSLKQAQLAWEYLISQKEITLESVLVTHQILMAHQNLRQEHIGHFRNCPVWVGNREGPDFRNVPNLVQSWLDRINALADVDFTLEERDLLLQNLHVQYEHIHPFVDGNGRTGRLFWNFLRLNRGLPLKIIYENERFEYYRIFR